MSEDEYTPYDLLADYLINGKPADMPNEVWVVLNWPYELMGLEQFNEFKAIKKKYPQYFPWETLYDSIPNEVHEAYNKEVNPWRFEEITEQSFEGSEGLIANIDEAGFIQNYDSKNFTIDDFDQVAKRYIDSKIEKANQYKKDKAIWDKHYKKYKLPYNG